MSEAYFTSGETLAATYGLLIAFFLTAGVAVPLMMRFLRQKGVELMSKDGVEFWFTARNSQSWPVIALSMTATSAGAWLLYTPAEAAYNGGWWALIGYCVAISLGPLFIITLGPKFREQCGDAANITDWVYDRFGAAAHIWFSLVLIYYMFIYMVGQLKTMGDMLTMFSCPGGVGDTEGCVEPRHGIVPVAVFTVVYTMFGGLPASLMTDQIQALAILIIVVILSFFVFTKVEYGESEWSQVSVWTDRGFEMGWSLCFAVFGAEVFNLAFWQRVYIAKDDRDLRIGFAVGACLVAFLTFLFGLVGLMLKAQDLSKEVQSINVPAFTFFEINSMPGTTHSIRMLVFVLATCMITSCVDSFQIGITSVITRFLQKWEIPYKHSMLIGLAALLAINVPAVAFAQYAVNDVNENFDGLAVKLTDLFSMADIVTITLVVPIFSGLWQFVTKYGALAGMFSGMLTIVVWGWVEFGTFIAGLEMITMMCFGNTKPGPTEDGAPGCGFYARRAAMIFPTIVLVTAVVTYVFSWMENTHRNLGKIAKPAGSTMEGIKAV